jgi:hypothetical protein
VLETPEGKKRYQEELKKIIGKTFRVDLIQARAKELSAKIKPALKEKGEEYEKAASEFMNRLTARHKSADQQIKSL